MEERLQKIKTERKLKGFTWKELAEELPIDGNSLRIAFTRNKVDEVYLQIVENKLEIAQNVQSVNESPAHYSEVFTTKSGNRIETLENGKVRLFTRLVHVKAQASYVSSFQDVEYLDELQEVMWTLDRVPQGMYRSFEVMNDSMNDGTINSIPDGSIVLGRELGKHHWNDGLRFNKFPNWIIVHKDTIMIKEITAHDKSTGVIKCHSLNSSPEFSDFEINLQDVNQLYNVVKRQLD